MTPIDVATGTVGTPIGVGLNPGGFAITPDGQTLLVGAGGGSGFVKVVNLANDTIVATVSVGSDPSSIAVAA